MNKEYIKEMFEEYKETFEEYELEIETPEDLESFIETTIISNMQYDFNITPDTDKLFNKQKEIDKELNKEHLEKEEEQEIGK